MRASSWQFYWREMLVNAVPRLPKSVILGYCWGPGPYYVLQGKKAQLGLLWVLLSLLIRSSTSQFEDFGIACRGNGIIKETHHINPAWHCIPSVTESKNGKACPPFSQWWLQQLYFSLPTHIVFSPASLLVSFPLWLTSPPPLLPLLYRVSFLFSFLIIHSLLPLIPTCCWPVYITSHYGDWLNMVTVKIFTSRKGLWSLISSITTLMQVILTENLVHLALFLLGFSQEFGSYLSHV